MLCVHRHKCVKSLMCGLSLLSTQRGLSETEDTTAASSPTVWVPELGKVGVKEGDMHRLSENEMEREREGEA